MSISTWQARAVPVLLGVSLASEGLMDKDKSSYMSVSPTSQCCSCHLIYRSTVRKRWLCFIFRLTTQRESAFGRNNRRCAQVCYNLCPIFYLSKQSELANLDVCLGRASVAIFTPLTPQSSTRLHQKSHSFSSGHKVTATNKERAMPLNMYGMSNC